MEAVKKGDLTQLKYLVSTGLDIRSEYRYAIIWASSYGHLELVKYLV